jgi:hypothetical protein
MGERKDLAEEILNRIVTDDDFRQQVLDNPGDALAQAGWTGTGDDVSGYGLGMGGIAPTPPLNPAGAADPGGGGSMFTGLPGSSGGVPGATSGNPAPITTAMGCGGGSKPSTVACADPPPPVNS